MHHPDGRVGPAVLLPSRRCAADQPGHGLGSRPGDGILFRRTAGVRPGRHPRGPGPGPHRAADPDGQWLTYWCPGSGAGRPGPEPAPVCGRVAAGRHCTGRHPLSAGVHRDQPLVRPRQGPSAHHADARGRFCLHDISPRSPQASPPPSAGAAPSWSSLRCWGWSLSRCTHASSTARGRPRHTRPGPPTTVARSRHHQESGVSGPAGADGAAVPGSLHGDAEHHSAADGKRCRLRHCRPGLGAGGGRAGRRAPPVRRHSGRVPALGSIAGAGAVAVLSLAVLPGPPGVADRGGGARRGGPRLPDAAAGHDRGRTVGHVQSGRPAGAFCRPADRGDGAGTCRRPCAGRLAGQLHSDGVRHGGCRRPCRAHGRMRCPPPERQTARDHPGRKGRIPHRWAAERSGSKALFPAQDGSHN